MPCTHGQDGRSPAFAVCDESVRRHSSRVQCALPVSRLPALRNVRVTGAAATKRHTSWGAPGGRRERCEMMSSLAPAGVLDRAI